MYNLRRANKADIQELVPLLISSAPRLLPRLFDQPPYTANDYLNHALSRPKGQFGYANHRVIIRGEKVAAIACSWQGDPPQDFVTSTFDSLASYYPAAQLLAVLQRCQALQEIFPRPQPGELCLGHIAVAAQHRRQGLASQLLGHFQALGLKLGKTALTLDVEASNHVAIDCYHKFGFILTASHMDHSELALGHYVHLRKVL